MRTPDLSKVGKMTPETCESCRAIWRWYLAVFPIPQAGIRHFKSHQRIDLAAS